MPILVFILVVAAISQAASALPTEQFDLQALWVAGRLLAGGFNPYDLQLFEKTWVTSLGVAFPNDSPLYGPQAAPLLLLAQLVEWRFAWLFWAIFLGFTLVLSNLAIVKTFPIRNIFGYAFFVCISLVFLPTVQLIRLGQTSSIPLLGFAAVVWCFRKDRGSLESSIFAGLCLALVSIKPQLSLAFGAFLLLRSVNSRRYTTLAISVLAAMLLSVPALFLRPTVFNDYFGAISQQVAHTGQFATPTLVAWSMQIFGLSRSLAVSLNILLCLAVVGALFRFLNSMQTSYCLAAWILPLGCIFAPYQWTYDFILLFPACICLVSRCSAQLEGGRRTIMLAIMAAVLLATIGLSFGPPDMAYTVWYPFAIFGLVVLEYTSHLKRNLKCAKLSCEHYK